MGYPFGKKGWYLFDLEMEEFFSSADVVFYEDHFPFRDSSVPVPLAPLADVVDTDDSLVEVSTDSTGSTDTA